MVQGKTGTLSYKSRKLVGKPEEEWIRVEGTHEPIISRELWDTVASIDKQKVRKSSANQLFRVIFRKTGLFPNVLQHQLGQHILIDGVNGAGSWMSPSSLNWWTALRLEKPKKWVDSGFVTSVFTTVMWAMWTRRWRRKKGGSHLKKQYKETVQHRHKPAAQGRENHIRIAAYLHKVTPQAGQVFDQNQVNQAVAGILQHFQKSGPLKIAAAVPIVPVMWAMWTRRWRRKKGGSHLKKQYKVGIYCRLSVDDASNSAKAKNYIPGDEILHQPFQLGKPRCICFQLLFTGGKAAFGFLIL